MDVGGSCRDHNQIMDDEDDEENQMNMNQHREAQQHKQRSAAPASASAGAENDEIILNPNSNESCNNFMPFGDFLFFFKALNFYLLFAKKRKHSFVILLIFFHSKNQNVSDNLHFFFYNRYLKRYKGLKQLVCF